jgi:PAS domain S-box-containing protein
LATVRTSEMVVARLEEQVRELRAALEDAAEGICRIDLDGRVLSVNRAFTRLIGSTAEASIGRNWEALVAEEDRDALRGDLRALGEKIEREVRGVRADGSTFEMQLSIMPVLEPHASRPIPKGHYFFIRDLSDRKRMENQLIFAGRMAAVGTLAAGVAHEINNPLSVVAGNLLILKQDFESVVRALGALPSTERVVAAASSSFREAVADAEEATERVRLLTRDLRVFSHPDEVKREAVDVHNVLESAIRMARNELRPRATVVRRFGDVPKVQANEARLGQVFLNLLVNAAHAIPEGHREDQTITLVTGRQDEMVVVDVIDTGVGIPPEVLPRIFDIFFTTKPVGIGTGMGLAICHRILTSLGGRIEVQSRVGEGTRFRVLLQRARSGATLELPVEASKIAGPARERTASLLVVEDEPALGRVLPRLLSPHRVTVVERGAEALARILAGERFDVILCDIMMPEMTGMEFHRELSRVRPEIAARVVFMSGGVFTPGVRSFLDEIPNRRIDKPLDIDALRRLIGEALPDSDRGR